MAWFMGVDIGSKTSKGVIITDGKLAAYHLLPSGINYAVAAQKLREKLLAKAGLSVENIKYTVSTGQGSGSVSFHNQQVTDTRSCARGIKIRNPIKYSQHVNWDNNNTLGIILGSTLSPQDMMVPSQTPQIGAEINIKAKPIIDKKNFKNIKSLHTYRP